MECATCQNSSPHQQQQHLHFKVVLPVTWSTPLPTKCKRQWHRLPPPVTETHQRPFQHLDLAQILIPKPIVGPYLNQNHDSMTEVRTFPHDPHPHQQQNKVPTQQRAVAWLGRFKNSKIENAAVVQLKKTWQHTFVTNVDNIPREIARTIPVAIRTLAVTLEMLLKERYQPFPRPHLVR